MGIDLSVILTKTHGRNSSARYMCRTRGNIYMDPCLKRIQPPVSQRPQRKESGGYREKNVPTEQYQAQTLPWLPGTHEHARWPEGAFSSSGQGPSAPCPNRRRQAPLISSTPRLLIGVYASPTASPLVAVPVDSGDAVEEIPGFPKGARPGTAVSSAGHLAAVSPWKNPMQSCGVNCQQEGWKCRCPQSSQAVVA